jgi:CheY-like chemotaxis protein
MDDPPEKAIRNQARPPGIQGVHVIVVDDVPDIRQMVRMALEHFGCRVTEAGDGNEALERQAADPADVVITDIVMPGQDGVETIGALRKAYPALRIIAMSGHDLASTWLTLAEKMGVSAVLVKPFTIETLASTVGVYRANRSPTTEPIR